MRPGTIELLAVRFQGNRFTREIIETLNDLGDRGTMRIVDLVFASRNTSGELRMLKPADLDTESLAALEPLVEEELGVLSQDDVVRMGTVLRSGSTAGLILFENVEPIRQLA